MSRGSFVHRFGLVLALAAASCASRAARAASSFMSENTFSNTPLSAAEVTALRDCWSTGKCSTSTAGQVRPYPDIPGQVLNSGCFNFVGKQFSRVGNLGAPNAAGYMCPAGQFEVKVGHRTDCPPTPTDPSPGTCDKGGFVSMGCTLRRIPGGANESATVAYECFGGNRIIADASAPGGPAECAAGTEYDPATDACLSCAGPNAATGLGGTYKTSAGRGSCILCDSSKTVDGHGDILRAVDPSYQQCLVKEVKCDTGYEPDASGMKCQLAQCQAGEFRTTAGAPGCSACPGGTFKTGPGDGPCTACTAVSPAPALPANTVAAGVTLGTWNAARDDELPGSTSPAACNYKVNSCVAPSTVASPPTGCSACVPSTDVANVNSCAYKATQTCQGVAVTGTGTCGESCGFGSKTDAACAGNCPATNPNTPYPAGVTAYTLAPGSAPPACAYHVSACNTAGGFTLTGTGSAAYCASGSSPTCTCDSGTAALVCTGEKYADSCGKSVCDGAKTAGCTPTTKKPCDATTAYPGGGTAVPLPAAPDGTSYTFYSKYPMGSYAPCAMAADCSQTQFCYPKNGGGASAYPGTSPSKPTNIGIAYYTCRDGTWTLPSSGVSGVCACECKYLYTPYCDGILTGGGVTSQMPNGVCLAPYGGGSTGKYKDGFCTHEGMHFEQGKGPVPDDLNGGPGGPTTIVDPGCFNPGG